MIITLSCSQFQIQDKRPWWTVIKWMSPLDVEATCCRLDSYHKARILWCETCFFPFPEPAMVPITKRSAAVVVFFFPTSRTIDERSLIHNPQLRSKPSTPQTTISGRVNTTPGSTTSTLAPVLQPISSFYSTINFRTGLSGHSGLAVSSLNKNKPHYSPQASNHHHATNSNNPPSATPRVWGFDCGSSCSWLIADNHS